MSSLQTYIDHEIDDILSKCTGCGVCAEVCPILPYTAAQGEAPRNVVAGVLAVLRGATGNSRLLTNQFDPSRTGIFESGGAERKQQDAQKGRPARPEGAKPPERTPVREEAERLRTPLAELFQHPVRAAAEWIEACAGSGVCVTACPEPVNPRRMMLFARNAINQVEATHGKE